MVSTSLTATGEQIMATYNVYRDIDGQCEAMGQITEAEHNERVAAMVNVDPAGMPGEYAYKDATGIVWGFAAVADLPAISASAPAQDLEFADWFARAFS